MPDSLARRKLTSAAAHLNVRSGYAGQVPPLVLMTDDDRLPDPLAAARALPRGAMIVVRSREASRRSELAYALVALARQHGLIVTIANDAKLAVLCGADGLHLSQVGAKHAPHWRALRPHWFISVSAHSLRSALLNRQADAILLSPVFATRSHPGASALTPVRANAIAHALSLPIYALGGVTGRNAALLDGFAGIAAVGALCA